MTKDISGDSRLLAVIPARGGSKGVPGKNLAVVANRPLISWTIEAASNAVSVGRIVVSTDDPEIASVAQDYGAEVPFLRPAKLALDSTPGIDPILHMLQTLMKGEEYNVQWVVTLQPTCPLRTGSDIDAAYTLAREKNADSVVSVTAVKNHPFWMKIISDDGFLSDFSESSDRYPTRQSLPPVFALNGAIYLSKTQSLLSRRSWYTDRTIAYQMPSERSLDIDTSWELYVVDLILKDRENA